MTEITCPECGSLNVKAVATISHSYMSWSSMKATYSHIMQCRDCKNAFELREDEDTGDLLPYEPASI